MDSIKIVNFEKFNPRKDRAKHSWVRVDNTIAFSENLDGLDPDQKWFWIFLLSSASRKQCELIELNFSYFEKHSGVSLKKMKAALTHFEKREMIQLVPQSVIEWLPGGDRAETNGITTNVRTNITNITNMSIQVGMIYSKFYPRKEGKSKGIELLLPQMKSDQDLIDLENAVQKYAAHVKANKTDAKFVKMFSTFASTWRDWLDENAGEGPKSKNYENETSTDHDAELAAILTSCTSTPPVTDSQNESRKPDSTTQVRFWTYRGIEIPLHNLEKVPEDEQPAIDELNEIMMRLFQNEYTTGKPTVDEPTGFTLEGTRRGVHPRSKRPRWKVLEDFLSKNF